MKCILLGLTFRHPKLVARNNKIIGDKNGFTLNKCQNNRQKQNASKIYEYVLEFSPAIKNNSSIRHSLKVADVVAKSFNEIPYDELRKPSLFLDGFKKDVNRDKGS